MSKHDTLVEFFRLTRPLMQQVETSVEAGLAGTGLTVRMRAVLEILAENGSLSVPDLARTLGVQRQYVQRMVNETGKAGLTAKRNNPRHKSSRLIVLTAYGADLISEVRAREKEVFEQVADRLDLLDIDTALSVAQHCHSALRRLNGNPSGDGDS